jgi:hypothetical protein
VRVAYEREFIDLPVEETGLWQRCSFEPVQIEIQIEIEELAIAD